jgi:hypothetical protein
MQAIVTTYKGPTDTKGSRIIVRAERGRIVVPWDYALDVEGNHRAACKTACKRWQWDGRWVGGGTVGGTRVWVCASWVGTPRVTIRTPRVKAT